MMTDRRTLHRRSILGGVVSTLAAPAIVAAQVTYPDRPVRIICPFAAGGPADTLSRLYSAKMSELSGHPWIVENRGGSGGRRSPRAR